MNKTQFNNEAERIINDTRAGTNGMDDRQVRIEAVKKLTETYAAANGKRPDQAIVERLTDVILYEELTDDDRMKVRNNEYPFLSERQFERRRSEEVGLKVAEEIGTDGKTHKAPKRRKRTDRENRLVNLKARSRNREIAKKYREFTETQPVVTKTMMTPEEIEAYLSVKYTEYQRMYAKGHGKF
jgi:hypothetical protein